MFRRFVLLFTLLVALSAVQTDRADESTRAVRLVHGSAGCSSWQNDRIHYYRPPRRLPSDEVDRPAPAGEIDLGPLEAQAADFGGRLPDLGGTWARLLVTASSTDAPLVGEMQMTTSTIQRLVQTQRGSLIDITVDVCLIEVDSEGPMRTFIPDAFVAGIGRTDRSARLEPLGSGFRFIQDRLFRVLGAQLDSPQSDPLPTDEGDATAFDQDADGHPGMTVRLEGMIGGQVYTAQRITRDLEGIVRDRDTIDGYIAWTLEQTTLGASSFMLNIDSNPRVDPTVERNYFRSTRIDDAMDCSAIIAARDQLFAR